MARSFNRKQRDALWLAADGRCELCGCELPDDFHADHIHPYSRGGDTDVMNGQALCPKCNLAKGNTMDGLRRWQEDAIDAYDERGIDDFLLVACPGSARCRRHWKCCERCGRRRQPKNAWPSWLGLNLPRISLTPPAKTLD